MLLIMRRESASPVGALLLSARPAIRTRRLNKSPAKMDSEVMRTLTAVSLGQISSTSNAPDPRTGTPKKRNWSAMLRLPDSLSVRVAKWSRMMSRISILVIIRYAFPICCKRSERRVEQYSCMLSKFGCPVSSYFKSAVALSPLMRPTKCPDIPVSLERNTEVFRQHFLGASSTLLIWTGGSTPLLCLEGVPDLPVAPQDEAGLTTTFQTWPRGRFHIP